MYYLSALANGKDQEKETKMRYVVHFINYHSLNV